MRKVVLVTGANSGVGHALCQRLLQEDDGLHLCLACRNPDRAEAARAALLASCPSAQITAVQVDVSDPRSVLRAAGELRRRFRRLDCVYLNAGIMPQPQLDVGALLSGLFSRRVVHMLCTAEGLLIQHDRVTADGLQEVFATNVFGHFLLVECPGAGASALRWRQPGPAHLDVVPQRPEGQIQPAGLPAPQRPGALQLLQVRHGPPERGSQQEAQPAGEAPPETSPGSMASVPAVGGGRRPVLQLGCREDRDKGLYSSVACPGTMLTSMTYGILPAFVWTLLMPIIWLLRFLVNGFTLTPHNGAEVLVWLFRQRPESLDPLSKYLSTATGFGSTYVTAQKMDLDEDTAERFYHSLLELDTHVRATLQGTGAQS
ncbi:3-keto-steroid reductase/17-beta-hydroxysteroid dehydrogenase 7 isoform X4 [Rousettus aegyptiacus]|uniref:3-keto-steroid reductase/17-beta-hydroxysteroid dehydrogenase 7 isoform X4 n=1 Tax=Rousettus aegyptiacus TaxID=9407 RepID=UPI00168D547A|nr:3-keto-steroid reductase/17-beta-hydroxysteroid dehydrogenase 7 isoform X4 [Rousettus aegyptiacus]